MLRRAAVLYVALALWPPAGWSEEPKAAPADTTTAAAPTDAAKQPDAAQKPDAAKQPDAATKPDAAKKTDKPARVDVTYRDDKLTVRLERAPLADVIEQLHKQSGVEVKGSLRDPHDVTAEFSDVPLKQGLERLLGEQNFALNYEGDKLTVLELRGGPEEKGSPPVGMLPPNVPIGPNETPPSWMAMYMAFEGQEKIPIKGRFKEIVGKDAVGWDYVMNMAMASDETKVRKEAVQAAVTAFESNPELKDAVLSASSDMSDADLAAFARRNCLHWCEDLVRNFARESHTPEVRTRARALLRQLKRMPYQGPMPNAGEGSVKTQTQG